MSGSVTEASKTNTYKYEKQKQPRTKKKENEKTQPCKVTAKFEW